jgi:putative flippase GtrA
MPNPPKHNKTLLQIARFGGVGVAATVAHASALYIFVEYFLIPPSLSNAMAFLCAVLVTYFGQSYWVFNTPEHSKKRITKFLTVAGLGLVLNFIIMYMTVHFTNIPYMYGFLIATILIPCITFILNKLWVFTVVE